MAKNISKGDLRKEDFLVLRQSRDNTVTNVIAPNGLQVGLTDNRFQNPLTVKGSTIGEGGLTGSLTQLVDGTPYLRAGSNIILSTGSAGQITISTSINDVPDVAVRRNKQQYEISSLKSAGTTVSLTNSAFNSIGITDTNDFIDVYHNNVLLLSGSVSDVTAGTKDYYIDRANNTAVFGFDLVTNDTIITSVISSGSAQLAGAGDALLLTNNTYNVNVGSTGGIQITSDALALKFKSAGGLSSDSSGVFVDINSQTNLGASVDTGDFVLVYDVTDSTIKKVSVGNIQGAGASIDIAGVSNSLTETTLASGDLFAVADVDASNETKKITVEDFGQYLAAETNSGIGESSGQLTIDLNDLSAATVAVASDSIAIIDADDNTTKKESIADLISGVAGTVTDTGLAASSGVLSLDITNQTSVGTISTSDEIIIYDVDASAFKKATINDLQAGSSAPPAAEYVVLSANATLTGERILTTGDGLDLTDGGAGGNVTLGVDVSDIIDTSYGLTESSNDIRVALKSNSGLTFDGGEIKVDYGSTSGLAAEGSNQVNILAGDGLKTGGSFSIGASTSTIQLDIKPSDFAGNGLKVVNDDLVVSIGAGDNITIVTGSDGSFIISSSLAAEGIYTAGNGLDLTGQEFSVDLKSAGGLKIDSTELAVEVDDFIGNGLENDGSDNIRVKPNTVQGTGYAGVHVNANGVSVRYDNVTIGDAGSGVLEVKDGSITTDKLQNNSVTVVAGDGLRNGGEVELGDSVTLNIAPSDFAGTGLAADGFFNLNIDDSIVATLSGSVFSGHVGVTGSIHSTAEISGSIVKASKLSGSLTTLENGSPYLLAGTGISLTTGSSGQITITGNVGDITSVTAGNGLSGGGDTGDVSLTVDDSIVATLSGSVFSGHVGVTGSIHSTAEISGSLLKASKLSGSLTTLENGDPYLLAGSGISLATGSDGSVTITGNVGAITAVNVGTGLSGGGDTGDVTVSIDDSIVATLSGSVFSGHVGVTGSIHSTAEISGSILKGSAFSGSLTTLENGNPYLLAGTGISLLTGSDGSVTITGNVGDITGVTAGTGLSGGGDTGDVSLDIDDSVVATLTSSVNFSNGISGSLTNLSDGSSFIIAGQNITVTSASNGAITIQSSFTNTEYTAGTGLELDGTQFNIKDDIVATLSGSVFSGHVGVTGSIHSTSEISGSSIKAAKLSGSLTTLENGNPYLLAGSGISLLTGSDGSVTITGNVGDITAVTAGTGLSGGGDTGAVTLNIDDSIVATLTSSASFPNGLSGSLTNLSDGSSFIIAGDNVSVTSGSNGAITIASSFTNTEYTAGNGLSLDGTEFGIDNSVVATLSGSVFSGHVGVTGSIHSTDEIKAVKLSGSLTTLENGNPYLKAGSQIILSTGSDGSVTIAGDFSQNSPGSPTNSVQFNNAGDFEGDSNFVFDSTDSILTLSGTVQQFTSSIKSSEYSGGVNLIAPSDLSSDITLKLPSSVGSENQLLKSDGSGNLSFGYADRVHVNVRNISGATIEAGTPVHINGYLQSGKLAIVVKADASIASQMPASAVLTQDLANNTTGTAVMVGFLDGIDTSGNSIGDTLYVAEGGGITATRPSGLDSKIQTIGNVLSVNSSEGIMFVDVTGRSVDNPNIVTATGGISGSLTKLSDGSSYLIAGNNITISSSSNGAVTIESSFTNTEYTAGDGLDLTTTEFSLDLKSGSGLVIDSSELSIDDSILATISGSVFSGHVGVTGSIHATQNVFTTQTLTGSIVKASKLSGSLTTLENGNAYLLAGSGITIATGSDGSVTITNNASADITEVTAGTGLTGGGSSGEVTLDIDNSVVATLSGSVFSGHVGVTGSIHSTAEIIGTIVKANKLSGSLTTLENGNPYLLAGSNITLLTGSDGSVTITANDSTEYTAGEGLELSGTEFSIDDSIVATLSGSVFSGHVGVTGSIHSTAEISGSMLKAAELSGSLTTLENGNPYLLAGTGISLATGSDGSVTITGNVGDITGVTAGTGLNGGGTNGTVTLDIDDSIVATLTSSVSFSNGISGSLTNLSDGSSYIIAGSNVTVTSASNGAVTIASSFTNTEYTAGTGLNLDSTQFSIDDSIVATLSGSVFSGHVGVTGSIHSTTEVKANKLSGSLTTLENGNPYLKAGTDIILSTGSDGSVTISGDFSQNEPGTPVNSVQFNTAGDFDGDEGFVYDSSDRDLVLSGTINVLTTSLRTTNFANKIDLRAPSSLVSDYTLTLPSSNGDTKQLLKTDGDGNLDFDFADRVFIDVRNGSGGALTKGTPVHISGYHTTNKRPLVVEAQASTPANMPAFGILAEDLPTADSEGKICISGYLDGLNTSAFSVSDTLYVGAAGGLTINKPSGADDEVQPIGVCVSVSNTIGIILVKPVGIAESPNSIDVVEVEADTITATTGFSGSLTHLADGSSYLIAGDNISIVTGSNGAVTISSTVDGDGVPGGSTSQVQFNDGGSFGGSSNFTFDSSSNSLTVSNLSGSLTHLSDGSSYLVAGSNVTITTGSNGSVTIASTGGGGGGSASFENLTASTGLTGTLSNGDANIVLAIDDSVVATLSGSVFSGHVGVTGSIHSTAEISGSILKASAISGSLTHLEDGSSYLVAGSNIQVVTGATGAITISSTDTNTEYTAGDGLDLSSTVFSLDLKSNSGLIIDSTELSVDDSIIATLSGSVFSGHVGVTGSIHSTAEISGSILKAPVLTGSLTKLEDGSSYLIAGSNVTITTGSNGAVTISSTGGGGGGSITATSGSTSIASMSTIKFGPGLIMNEDSSGVASVTASIGEAEDGTYADGLFTDFTPQTHIGTAVDRFNEILAALSPSPAPALDDISENVTNGITAFLSFGASSDQTSQSPAYPSVLDSAGIEDEVDVNESYSFTNSGNNIRLGIYDGTQNISGILNDDVSLNSQGGGYTNYPANSFGDGDTGVLKLEVNGTVIKEIDLTVVTGNGDSGSGTASELNANGSGFTNLSTATDGTFSNGNTFSTFKHRTGRYVVDAADQRNGWNYLRIQHVKTGSTTTTNYVEWVNDDNSDALASAGSSLTFEGSGSIHLSGVEYFRSGSLTYKNRVTNAYKYIYDTTNISFTTSNSATLRSGQTFNFASQAKPTIDTGSGEDHDKILHITASSDLDASYFINGSVTVGSNVTHPLKSNLSNSGQATANQILMYDLSNTSTNQQENFRRENFRIISASYDSQASVIDSANVWNSTAFMTSSNAGHSDGLQFYNQQLLSPTNTLNSGNFSTFANGPFQNPDYSGETGERTFLRWFKNETGSTQYDLSLTINGSGTIVSEGSTLNTTNINVLIKFPGTTGYLDVAEQFLLDAIQDGDGAHIDNAILNFDSSLNATNYINFGNAGIADDEYVVIKIVADASWNGNISQITVNFGSGTGTLTPIPDLDDIDSDNSGTSANLSFGSSKAITGYTSHGTGAGFSEINLNGLFSTLTSGNNLRRAIFNGSQTMEGDLNEDVSSPGNDFVANAFSDANSGSLKLEVNGSVIHEVEITGSYNLVGSGNPGSGTGTSLNGNGSGFISLSTWAPGLFDNGVPRYSEIQRTGRYRITSTDQRNGWNYARVIHSVSGVDRNTNYVEWVNDNNSDALSSAGNSLTIFGDNNFSYISGVKYFNSPSGSILTRISNIYKNIYSDSSSAISFTGLTNATATKIIQSGSGLTLTKETNSSTDSLQTLNTNSDSQNEFLHISGTIDFNRSKSLPGTYTTAYSCGGRMVFDHPLKSNLTTPSQTTTNMLVWTPSDTSNANTNEYFTGEAYRLVSGSYTAQTDVSGGSNDWNSERSINDNTTYPEHATGLLIYDTYLIPPKDAGNNGDFRNHDEGGAIESPSGNVNYSSLTKTTRDYFRSFLNNTTNDRPSVQVTLYGDANIVGRTGANQGTLGSNKNIFVEIGIPGKTGLLDLGKPSAGSGNYNEGDGCLSGDLDATVDSGGATNTATFNGRTVDGTVSGAEYLVIRISASENWTGYLDRISVGWS